MWWDKIYRYTGMLLNAGKKLKEACAARVVPVQFTRHSNQSG